MPPFSFEIITRSTAQTRRLGREIGRLLHSGTCLALCGDLGSGKTVFVQGLALGLDVPAHFYVTSPSYTIINEYPGRLPLFHIDLYRIEGTDALEETGFFEIIAGPGVVAIEWADRLSEDIGSDHLALRFQIADESLRVIRLIARGAAETALAQRLEKEKKWL